MRCFLAAAVIAAMMLQISPLFAAAQAGASISGAARTSSGRLVANTTVRVRNLMTNQIAGMTTSNAAGQFSFAGLMPGTYAVEVMNAAGEIIGTSSAVTVAAGAAITGVTVTAAVASSTAAATGLSTAAIVAIVAGGAAVATVIAVKSTASPSQ